MGYFEEAYHGRPPWDIGRAQQEFVHLEKSGEISGDVLDVGCGTGENALCLAARGHNTWGVDSVPAAIEAARKKAEERGLAATFLQKDALHLHEIGRTFDTAIDSGLFHTLSEPDRPRFVRSLSMVLKPGKPSNEYPAALGKMIGLFDFYSGTFSPMPEFLLLLYIPLRESIIRCASAINDSACSSVRTFPLFASTMFMKAFN